MRIRSIAIGVGLVAAATLGACGGGGSATDQTDDTSDNSDGGNPDAAADPNDAIGFAKPAKAMAANMGGTELGAADLTCLGTPTSIMPATTAITIDPIVADFQTKLVKSNVSVTAFAGTASGSPFAAAVLSGSDGKVSITIPQGTTLFGFKMTSEIALDTLLLNQFVPPTPATQDYANIQVVSKTTAETIPTLVGLDARTPGTGIVAGAIRDCQNHEISNVIATVSSTASTATFISGAKTYYFQNALPTRHNRQAATNTDGLFTVLEIPVAASAYVQLWGYATEADRTADHLTLVAEFQAPVLADTVVTGSFRPKRTAEQ